MKYKLEQKQNQRITRITESTLVVGADIAKRIHVARAVDFRGIGLGKECVFHNDSEGLMKLSSWMKELGRAQGKTDIVLGIEPTGHYWFPLAAFLQEQRIQVVVVNPHHVSQTKELGDNSPTKSDYKDAKVIADLIRNGNYSEPKLPTKAYADLRILMNSGKRTNADGAGSWRDHGCRIPGRSRRSEQLRSRSTNHSTRRFESQRKQLGPTSGQNRNNEAREIASKSTSVPRGPAKGS